MSLRARSPARWEGGERFGSSAALRLPRSSRACAPAKPQRAERSSVPREPWSAPTAKARLSVGRSAARAASFPSSSSVAGADTSVVPMISVPASATGSSAATGAVREGRTARTVSASIAAPRTSAGRSAVARGTATTAPRSHRASAASKERMPVRYSERPGQGARPEGRVVALRGHAAAPTTSEPTVAEAIRCAGAASAPALRKRRSAAQTAARRPRESTARTASAVRRGRSTAAASAVTRTTAAVRISRPVAAATPSVSMARAARSNAESAAAGTPAAARPERCQRPTGTVAQGATPTVARTMTESPCRALERRSASRGPAAIYESAA